MLSARFNMSVLLLIACRMAFADVSSSDCANGHSDCYAISDEITSLDLAELKRRLSSPDRYNNKNLVPVFFLDSHGGDIYAAMEIGRLLRKERAVAVVTRAASCMSACIFVLLGAVRRVVDGPIGIHRPYSDSTGEIDFETAQHRYRQLVRSVQLYLQEMNASERLLEAMIRIPPERVRILAGSEVGDFGLAGIDPVEEEMIDSNLAAKYGLTRREYLKRKRHAEDVCRQYRNDDDTSYVCQKRLMTQIY